MQNGMTVALITYAITAVVAMAIAGLIKLMNWVIQSNSK